VVEDDPAIRLPVARELKGQGYQVRSEADGLEMSQVASAFSPDLALLDVRLPDGPDGYEIARMLRAEADVAVLFLTANDGVDARLAGFEVGADDYMVKPFAMAELLARVRAVLRRAGRLSSAVSQVADLVVDGTSHQVTRAGAVLELTRTEFELLSAMVEKPGKVLSMTELMARVWGFDTFDVNLVQVHMSSLRRKMELHGRRLIHTVRGVGYELR